MKFFRSKILSKFQGLRFFPSPSFMHVQACSSYLYVEYTVCNSCTRSSLPTNLIQLPKTGSQFKHTFSLSGSQFGCALELKFKIFETLVKLILIRTLYLLQYFKLSFSALIMHFINLFVNDYRGGVPRSSSRNYACRHQPNSYQKTLKYIL